MKSSFREYHREITGTICSERGGVSRNGKPRWETTNTPIYHFRNGRPSVLHHFENRYSHYRGESTGSNSSFPGIRGFRNSLAPIHLASRPPESGAYTFARFCTPADTVCVTRTSDNRLIIAGIRGNALQNPIPTGTLE